MSILSMLAFMLLSFLASCIAYKIICFPFRYFKSKNDIPYTTKYPDWQKWISDTNDISYINKQSCWQEWIWINNMPTRIATPSELSFQVCTGLTCKPMGK